MVHLRCEAPSAASGVLLCGATAGQCKQTVGIVRQILGALTMWCDQVCGGGPVVGGWRGRGRQAGAVYIVTIVLNNTCGVGLQWRLSVEMASALMLHLCAGCYTKRWSQEPVACFSIQSSSKEAGQEEPQV